VEFGYEHRSEPVLKRPLFYRRLANSLGLGAALIAVSMLVGIAGYRFLENLSWLDAYVNAAMILSGMGPLHAPQSFWGKIFAGAYALYSGFAVLVIAGIAFAPLAHRILHKFHAEEGERSVPRQQISGTRAI
jgi:ABC-type Fe3+ transport system permease subunit